MSHNKDPTTLSKGEERILEILCDFANALEAATVNIKQQITDIIDLDDHPLWNPSNIKWEQAQGSSGPYDRSEDVNSLDHKELLKDLAVHQGKLSRDGYFYWTFQNGSTIGRKKRKT